MLYWGRLHPVESSLWIVLVAIAWGAAIAAWRRSRTQANLRSILPWFALVPPTAALLASFVSFGIREGFPTVQMSDRDAFMDWTLAWPMLLLVNLAGAGLAFVGVGMGVAKNAPWSGAGAGTWLVLALANAVSLGAVFANFPSA